MRYTVRAIADKMEAWIANKRDDQKERTAHQKAMEAGPEKMEPNPEKMESRAEHWEVPKEKAAVKTSGAMKKWHRGRNLAAGRCGEPKGRLRGKRKRLRQEGGKGIKDLGSRRPLYLRKERRTTNSIRGWSSRQRAHLGSGATLYKTLKGPYMRLSA
jgi:hypothetical protein